MARSTRKSANLKSQFYRPGPHAASPLSFIRRASDRKGWPHEIGYVRPGIAIFRYFQWINGNPRSHWSKLFRINRIYIYIHTIINPRHWSKMTIDQWRSKKSPDFLSVPHLFKVYVRTPPRCHDILVSGCVLQVDSRSRYV